MWCGPCWRGPRHHSGTATIWTLSRHDDRWLIDASPRAAGRRGRDGGKGAESTAEEEEKSVEEKPPPPEKNRRKGNQWPSRIPLAAAGATSFGALTSPRWVAKTVLSALRTIDEPEQNHGSGVALTFVSTKNPATS